MQGRMKRGQIGLVLLVVMAVVVALVMSIAARSLSDTVLSRQERESSAAFSVAETGIENALNLLRQGSVPQGTVGLSDSTSLISGGFSVNETSGYSLYLREGETAHIDLTDFSGGSLTISWTKRNDRGENIEGCAEGSATMPAALELSAHLSGATQVSRSYYNPSNCAIGGNGFTSSSDGGETYLSTTEYTVPVGATMIRLRPLYHGATIAVAGAGLTRTQLYVIQSSATGGDAQKEIEVKRGLDSAATVFDYAVFSGETIVK